MSRPATAAVRLLTGEREPVRLATTADILLHGLQAIDGVPTEIGDRVLVKDQADPTQNGIYTASEGDWFRAADARSTRTLQKGTTVHTQVGSVNADRVFEFTADEPAIGADAITIAASVPPDIADVVEEVEALRDETQALKDAAAASAGQATASAAASAANAGQTTADRAATNSDAVAAAAAVISAQAARDASLYGKGIFPTTAAAIGFGVAGNGAITPGSGGANGTFDLAFTGGTGSGAAGRFVVAGGALTQILITAPGSYTVAPTLSFAASAGLAGAAAAAVLGRNVDVGEYFWTEVSAGIVGLHSVGTGPIAVDTGIRASPAEIALISSRAIGPVPITGSVGGTLITNDSVYFWPGSVSAADEYLSTLELGFGAVPGTAHIVFAHLEGDGTLSLVSEQTISVPAGPSSVVSGLAILKPAGSVMGVQRTGVGSWYYTAGAIPNGGVEWFTAVVPTSHTAKTIGAANGPQWKATFTGEVAVKARAAYSTANGLVSAVGISQEIGWPALVNTGSDVPGSYSVIMQTPAPADGYITAVEVGAGAGAGAALIHVVDYLGGLVVNVLSTYAVTLINGVAHIPLGIPIPAGKYPAISGGAYKFQNSVNPQGIPAWIKAGALSLGATVASSAQHRYELRFTIKTGLLADADRALTRGGGNDGMNLLAGADPNGVVDATALFASATAAHPNPYVPPGNFALTAIPASGDGFWGPGKPAVNGKRFFIPRQPSLQNLYDGFRAKMAEHIANNDVFCLIADSIGLWALASDGPKHWFNLVTRFTNIGIADDEPGMTALRPSSTYVPTFYGVTVAGSVSTGSRGPIGESIILAAGATLSFTGAYEQVDVHYTQDAAQGSLAFAFDGGAAYKTVNCAGALALDRYSGPSLTAQAASGNYTLTAVGGPVEIIGLIRLGVKAAGSRPRLRTLRAAHGSYAFSSFNTARLTSAAAQCGYAGGKIVPILALGINDSFGTPPATISANIATIINALEAAAAPRILVMPPTRPSAAWDASYTGGRTYDAALGAIRQTYRSRNVLTIPIDGFDYINSGNYQEGLHFNDAGHDGNALRFIEQVAERG
ncbi:SGNH/GDSL hydrolase family protein [Mesorhizobium sp. M0437]|uniref:SGNH/GDSL hydrolase family protein n=1 Tax=Mesorhizobium sp. M0437 TaxID=2956945 RepID=UPI00333A4069